jgi:hypothetical protein
MTSPDNLHAARWLPWKHNFQRIRVDLPARTSTVYHGADWAGALLTIEHGAITLELRSGQTTHIATGGAFWLDTSDIAIVHATSDDPVQLSGIRRAKKLENRR